MSDSDEDDVALSDSVLGATLASDDTSDAGAAPLMMVRLPPARHMMADPLRDVIESNLVFNSLVRMIYGNDLFDPTDYFDYDDFPRTPISRQWLDQLPPPASMVRSQKSRMRVAVATSW